MGLQRGRHGLATEQQQHGLIMAMELRTLVIIVIINSNRQGAFMCTSISQQEHFIFMAAIRVVTVTCLRIGHREMQRDNGVCPKPGVGEQQLVSWSLTPRGCPLLLSLFSESHSKLVFHKTGWTGVAESGGSELYDHKWGHRQ